MTTTDERNCHVRMRHRLLRLLGVVSPSGAYPLPPRWAMSRKGRAYWHDGGAEAEQRRQELAYAADVVAGLHAKRPTVAAYGPGSVAAGGNIGSIVTGSQTGTWASDVARGPLTRFSTGEPVHDCGTPSGRQGGARTICDRLGCFTQQPYVPEAERGNGAH